MKITTTNQHKKMWGKLSFIKKKFFFLVVIFTPSSAKRFWRCYFNFIKLSIRCRIALDWMGYKKTKVFFPIIFTCNKNITHIFSVRTYSTIYLHINTPRACAPFTIMVLPPIKQQNEDEMRKKNSAFYFDTTAEKAYYISTKCFRSPNITYGT